MGIPAFSSAGTARPGGGRRRLPLRAAIAFILASAAAGQATANADADFLAAREAAKTGDRVKLERLLPRLAGHPLEPYAVYWRAKQRLDQMAPDEVRATLDQLSDTLLVDRLRADWVRQLGRTRQWAEFATEYPRLANEDVDLTCYGLQYRYTLQPAEALAEAKPLWFVGRDQPESCEPLFDTLLSTGGLSTEDVWTRLRLAAENGAFGLVSRVNLMLPAAERIPAKLLDAAQGDPARAGDRAAKLGLKSTQRAVREAKLLALHRLLRQSADDAAAWWRREREALPVADQRYGNGWVGMYLARRHDPQALAYFKEAERKAMNDLQLGWWARASMRTGDWATVQAAIDSMSPEGRQDSAWRYWKARALATQQKATEAETYYRHLAAADPGFYGLLAAEELGQPLQLKNEPFVPTAAELKAMQNLPAIRRALSFFQLDLRGDGKREWMWALRQFDDRQLLTAATLARKEGLYEIAINTANQTVQRHDYALRFLTPYQSEITAAARANDLDDALVFGVVRQESRFTATAISTAGAVGLMQVMPATAKWIAKRLSRSEWRPNQLIDVGTNVTFGAFYLKYWLDRLDRQPVLAAAGYNAGPGRAQAWRGGTAMEGAIYTESIPFNETRDYVKKVLTNAVYYAHLFGHRSSSPTLSLKARLGQILPRGNKSEPIENEAEPITVATASPGDAGAQK